jgi:hypothetical protein
MELVQGDPLHAERTAARVAGGDEVARAAVGDPAPSGPGQPALGREHHPRAVSRPFRQGPRDQPLVVAGLGLVAGVGVGGVEQGDARIEGGVQGCRRAPVVPVGIRGQPHAAGGQRAIDVHVHPMVTQFRKKERLDVDPAGLRSS